MLPGDPSTVVTRAAGGRQAADLVRAGSHDDDVAVGDRPERLEAADDLAFAVDGLVEARGEFGSELRERSATRPRIDADGPLPHVKRRHSSHGTILSCSVPLRAMPGGIRLFLVYALAILAGIGISLRYVIDLAIGAPVSGPGVVVMVLLAYTIFTTTLVIQRKQAARGLALGLASLTLPLIPTCALLGLIPQTIFVAALAALLFRGLLRPEVRAWLIEE